MSAARTTMHPTEITPPNGCHWCGIGVNEHCQRWAEVVGRHGWTEPTDAQRLERMRSNRIFRRRRAMGLIQPDLSEYEECALGATP